MEKAFLIRVLDQKKADDIMNSIEVLKAAKGKTKILTLILEGTNGDHKLALDIAKLIHESDVDFVVHVSGTLDAAGTILATAGKKGERYASLDAIFDPFGSAQKATSGSRLSPQNQSVLGGLRCLSAHRRGLKTVAQNGETLSAFEAKSLRIVDKVDTFESKYSKEEKAKKAPKRITSRRRTSGRSATNRSATNRSATNRSATNRSATNRSATNRSATNRGATNRSATNRSATNRSATNRSQS